MVAIMLVKSWKTPHTEAKKPNKKEIKAFMPKLSDYIKANGFRYSDTEHKYKFTFEENFTDEDTEEKFQNVFVVDVSDTQGVPLNAKVISLEDIETLYHVGTMLHKRGII